MNNFRIRLFLFCVRERSYYFFERSILRLSRVNFRHIHLSISLYRWLVVVCSMSHHMRDNSRQMHSTARCRVPIGQLCASRGREKIGRRMRPGISWWCQSRLRSRNSSEDFIFDFNRLKFVNLSVDKSPPETTPSTKPPHTGPLRINFGR